MGQTYTCSSTPPARPFHIFAAAALALLPALAVAQPAPDSGFADAVLRLAGTPAGNTLPVGGRLYGGTVMRAVIVDPTGGAPDFTGDDVVTFVIIRGDLALNCGQVTRAGLEACIRTPENTRTLIDILFPGSLSASLAGRDLSQLFAHQFLQTTAFGMTAVSEAGKVQRAEVGGLAEHEWYTSADGYSGRAWQGLYQFNGTALSIAGRYAQQDDALRTRSTSVAADFHPSVGIGANDAWRVGLTAHTSLSYSRSTDLDLGSIDVGAGAWSSVQHDFSRVRIGAGGIFQGTKTRVPLAIAGDELEFLAQVLNERGIAYDATYGGLVGVVIGPATTFNAKLFETRAVDGPGDRRPTRVLLASVSHLVGGLTPIDFGYKVLDGGGLEAHSIFFQGNFRW
jgi:hypothetical protein